MLTTTLDGLWVLQVLSGAEVLAPELGLRPYLPSAETPAMALAHPAAGELRHAGVITAAGGVDRPVLEWLAVLARREVAVLVHVQKAGTAATPERVLLANFSKWWVAVERCDSLVRVSGMTTPAGDDSAAVTSLVDRLLGEAHPHPMRPATLDVVDLIAGVRDPESQRRWMIRQRLDPDQIAALTVAADPGRSRQASLVAIGSGSRRHIDAGAVTIIDGPDGRLLCEHVTRGGKGWMVVGPGSPAAIGAAVGAMLARLPHHQARRRAAS